MSADLQSTKLEAAVTDPQTELQDRIDKLLRQRQESIALTMPKDEQITREHVAPTDKAIRHPVQDYHELYGGDGFISDRSLMEWVVEPDEDSSPSPGR